MNVVYPQLNPITAKTCGCNEKTRKKVAYAISEKSHSLCMDKKYMIQAQIEARNILLNYATSNSEKKKIIEKEINELKAALDLMSLQVKVGKLNIVTMIRSPCAGTGSGLSSYKAKISRKKFVICQWCFWITTSIKADYPKFSKCPQCGRACINCIPISSNRADGP